MTELISEIDAFDCSRIKRIIRFGETTVDEAVIPISEMTAINRNRSILRALASVGRYGYNRLSVYDVNHLGFDG